MKVSLKLAAISTVKDEADILEDTLLHLRSEGVDAIYVADGMSSDGTRDIYPQYGVRVFDDFSKWHRQPYWMTRLAQVAFEDGADWVLAVDADEFWYAPSGRTIAEELVAMQPGIGKLYAPMLQHIDYDYREPGFKPLPKVAVRAGGGVKIANGNHEASTVGGSLSGVLAIREIQFRSFEHFCRKIEERCRTLDPALPPGEGAHQTQYRGWTKEQLEPVWAGMVDRATVLDPIPLRR